MKNKDIQYRGYLRFQKQLRQLSEILEQAADEELPADKVYRSKARPLCFYLQALARIYKRIHNKHRFERMRLAFKSLEDQLGKADHYEALLKEVENNSTIPESIKLALKKHFNLELEALRILLQKDNWLSGNSGKCKTIQAELESADWLSDEEDREAVTKVLLKEIEDAEEEYLSGKLSFDDIEEGVHEFRRKLRWISIYAQVLDGLVQLTPAEEKFPEFAVYQTKEVVNSPFNLMPPAPKGITPIYIQQPLFYTLSWFIAEAGKWKDEGLRLLFLENSVKESGLADSRKAAELAMSYCPSNQHTLHQIKSTMKTIAEEIIEKHRLLQKISNDIRKQIQ